MYFYNSLVIRRLTDTHRVLRIVYQSGGRFRHTAYAAVLHADATACIEHALCDNGIGDGFCSQTSAEVWRSEPAYLLLCTIVCECIQLDCVFAV